MNGGRAKDPIALTARVSAVLVLVIGLAVIAGWYLRIPILVQPHPTVVPMGFNTAVSFILVSAGILGIGKMATQPDRPARMLVLLIGAILTALSTAILLQYAMDRNFGIDQFAVEAWITTATPYPGRMAPLTGFLFILIGVTFLMTPWLVRDRARVGQLAMASGLLLVTAGVAVVGGYAFGLRYLTGMFGHAPMAVNSAAAFVVSGLGLGAVGMVWNRALVLDRMRWSGLFVFLVLVVVGYNLWQGLTSYQRERVNQLTEQAATAVASDIDRARMSYVRALDRMARRLALGGEGYAIHQWESDAREYLVGYRGVRALALLSPEGELLNRVSRDERDVPDDDRYRFVEDPQRRNLFETAIHENRFVASSPMDLAFGGRGALLLTPYDTPDGRAVVLAAVEYQSLFDAMLAGAVPGFNIEVSLQQQVTFLRSDGEEVALGTPIALRSIPAVGPPWTIRVWPTKAIIRSASGPLPFAVLVLSLAAAGLVALSMWFAAVAQQRLQQVLDTRDRLDKAVETSAAIWRESTDMLCTIDAEGCFVSVSDAAKSILGYEPGELEGMRYIDLVDPADRMRTEAEARAIMAGRSTSSFVNRYRRKDGTIAHINWGSVWVPSLNQIVAVARNVSERMNRERQLASSEERLRIVLDQSGRVVRDRNGTSGDTHWVGSTEKLLGVPAGQLGFLPLTKWLENVHPDDRARIRALDEAAWRSGSGFRIEYRWIRPDDGRTIWLEDTGSVHGDRMVAVLTDVSAKHRTEEELERRVSERTIALERANAELEAFSYSVSHDLRTPLRAISGFAEILRDSYGDNLDEDGRHYLKRVLDGSNRMGMLIDDLLQIGRVSRQELTRQSVNLSELAASIIDGLQEAYPERQVEVDIEPELSVRADQRLAEVMLTNLLGNAWKFTGTVEHAKISVRREGEAICVADNGVGFDMKYSAQLFGVFQRLHGIDEFPGTGVGLATVRRIVERHGGTIWAEAEVGNGASFYFTFGE